RDAVATAVKQAFMTGLHQGSFVAAVVTAAAALVALAFLPSRARAPHTPAQAEVTAERDLRVSSH
ncbi:MAG TPA: hypothetical protein VE733_06150, partial [Streptosporangiaceae bacterium]|nr:hypothetical protein [Streptosporangiaceae bacterium]